MTAMIYPDPTQLAHYYAQNQPEIPGLEDLEDGPSAGEVLGWIFDPIGSAIRTGVTAAQKGVQAANAGASGGGGVIVAPINPNVAQGLPVGTPVPTGIAMGTPVIGAAPLKTGAEIAAEQIAKGLGGQPVPIAPPVAPGQPGTPFEDVSQLFPGFGQQKTFTGPQVGTALRQGMDQLVNGFPASSPLGSLFGAGFGPPVFGTGPMPGPLGELLKQTFGTPMLPSALDGMAGALMPNGFAGDPTWNALATHSEKVGRAVVRRVLGVTDPALQKLQAMMDLRQKQIQATSEHNVLMSDDAFKRAMIEHIARVSKALGIAAPAGVKSVTVTKFRTY